MKTHKKFYIKLSITFSILFSVIVGIPTSAYMQVINAKSYTAHLIGHAHIDLVWLWSWEETVHEIAPITFLGTLEQMEKMPGLTFAQSQIALYEAIEHHHPEIFQKIKEKVKEGTWYIPGGMWAESDANMICGESWIRQFLLGKGYMLEKFGVDTPVGWMPDTFGHPLSLPQILNQCGIKYYIFDRGIGRENPIFWWKGIDGSKVLCYMPPRWYNVRIDDATMEALYESAKKSGVKDWLVLYGAGDHGGGPRDTDVQNIQKFQYDPNYPQVVFDTPENYFQTLLAIKSDFPVIEKELNPVFEGCYTSQAKIKLNNRRAENLLLTAEKFSVNAVIYRMRSLYPKRDINEAWKITLRNQFHDILPGSSIGTACDETEEHYQEVFRRGKRALEFSLESISGTVNTQGNGIPVIVFNPLAWQRTDIAEVQIELFERPEHIIIADSAGNRLASQISEIKEKDDKYYVTVLFTARDVPSLGYKLYFAQPTHGRDFLRSSIVKNEYELENEFFNVRVDPMTGLIGNIFDKQERREVLAGNGNILQSLGDSQDILTRSPGSAWDIDLTGEEVDLDRPSIVKVTADGPACGKIQVTRDWRRSRFIQEITLYKSIPRIDIKLIADWNEREQFLKVAFPLNISNSQANYEIPFGSISRQSDGSEYPALKWIDVSGSDYGVSLLNDCKYGFDVNDNVMRMSLLRGPLYPDPRADEGTHCIGYALFPHSGSFKDANTFRRGYEFNNPLITIVDMSHPGQFPKEYSFIQVEPENVFLTAMKEEQGYYNRGIIIRVFEAFGTPTLTSITLPQEFIYQEVSPLERDEEGIHGQGDNIRFALKPYEIKTIKLTSLRRRFF